MPVLLRHSRHVYSCVPARTHPSIRVLLRHNRHRTGRSRSGASQLQETKQPRAEQPCTQQPGAKQPGPPHHNQEQSIQVCSSQSQSNQAYSQQPRAQQPYIYLYICMYIFPPHPPSSLSLSLSNRGDCHGNCGSFGRRNSNTCAPARTVASLAPTVLICRGVANV